MLKLLIKKQFLEIFRAYYYDEKKNKARSKASTILFLFGFVLLMAGLLGGIFTYLSIRLCRLMVAADVAWLYFALMGLMYSGVVSAPVYIWLKTKANIG